MEFYEDFSRDFLLTLQTILKGTLYVYALMIHKLHLPA